jgi:hypothetical protein
VLCLSAFIFDAGNPSAVELNPQICRESGNEYQIAYQLEPHITSGYRQPR